MLVRFDSVLAVVSWVAAAALVLMLIIGPQVIAEDKTEPSGEAAGAAPYASSSSDKNVDGESLFVDNCGSCHTLEAAGTSGQVGPVLDGTSLSATDIEAIVREGRGSMPAFGGDLSDAEIAAIATFIAEAP